MSKERMALGILVLVSLCVGAFFTLRLKGSHSELKPRNIEWVSLPAGTFEMGISLELMKKEFERPGITDAMPGHFPREVPAYPVTVTGFKIMKAEATVGQYAECAKAGRCPQPRNDDRCSSVRPDSSNLPMNCMDFNDAKAFCAWAGGDVPTEVEWEYAAKSAGKRIARYPWGDSPEPTCDLAIIDEGGRGCGRRFLWPVCSKPRGNTQQGLCDMAGNAWEWTSSIIFRYPGWDDIPYGIVKKRPEELFFPNCRVIRGGGIGSIKDYRTTLRGCHKDDFWYGGLTVRCVQRSVE